jgi:hypothetical protein
MIVFDVEGFRKMNPRLFLLFGAPFLLLAGCSRLPQQDFYGKAVDQYGHPVEGATVVCDLMFFEDSMPTKGSNSMSSIPTRTGNLILPVTGHGSEQ